MTIKNIGFAIVLLLTSVLHQVSVGLTAPLSSPSDAIPLIAPGAGFSAWRPDALRGWTTASSVALDGNDSKRLVAATIDGDAVVYNTADDPAGKTRDVYLFSAQKFGDVEAHVEFCLARGSNSGIYFMGRYEIQLLDSYGVPDDKLTSSHCGGVYQRSDERRDPQGYDGVAPTTNAARPAGEWQSLDVAFRAPRFDNDGRKIEDARFVKVVHNGKVIHEKNVRCTGPTRAARFSNEAAEDPLVIQGDHGPVGLRNLWVRPIQ